MLTVDSGKLMNYLKLRQPTLSIKLSSTLPAMEYLIEFRVIMAHNLTAQNMHLLPMIGSSSIFHPLHTTSNPTGL
jgi:hypothetical protein